MVVVDSLQIDLTVAISIPTYRCVCACSFDKHCVSVEQSLLSGDLPPLGFGGPHLSVTLWDLVNSPRHFVQLAHGLVNSSF